MAIEESIEKLKALQNNVTEMPLSGFRLTKSGTIKTSSIFNVERILEHDPLLAKKFAFNEFTYEIDLLEGLPQLMLEKGPIIDEVYPAILSYIEQKYRVLFQTMLLQGALTNVARRHTYNPVLDYFEQCQKDWDGTKRVADFLPTYLGVERSDVTTLITKLFFTGAVAKSYHPESKFDYVLDLVGGQGTGKTTLLKLVSNGWYTDNFEHFDDKDDYSNMLRALIVNDDELTATSKSSFETLKKFISSQILEYRPPYGRNMIRRNKSFVMARTTNELTYLKDRTGERRFLPLLANKAQQELSPVDGDLDQAYIDQLWGEFTTYYHDGMKFSLTPEQQETLNKQRYKFMYIDEEEAAIEEYLDTVKQKFVSSADIAFSMGEPNLVNNRKLSRKIKYVMDNRGGWHRTIKRVGGVRKRGYERD